MNEELHTPGKLKYDADWRELKAENGCVVARLPAADHGLRGKDHIEALASIKANGERLAALWNAALLSHIAKGEQARAVGGEPSFGRWTLTKDGKPPVLAEVLAFYSAGAWGKRYFNGIAWFSDLGVTEDPIAWMPAPPDPAASPTTAGQQAGGGEVCRFPDCRCPMDPGPEPDWCAKGLPHAPGVEACRAEQRGASEWVCDCAAPGPSCKPTGWRAPSVAPSDDWMRPDNTCPRCKQPAANLFHTTLPGDELDTVHCGCLYAPGVAAAAPASDDAARPLAWEQLRQQVGAEGWTAGEASNYFGFFAWGWSYRAQLEQQRADGVPRLDQPQQETP